jgi:hypothetical protein
MGYRTEEQNNLLQPACRDLSRCLTWSGFQLTPDDWRHLICAAILGQKTVPGLTGGIVRLGGSSKKLNKQQATKAITMIFELGDQPWTYDPNLQQAVVWRERAVRKARGIKDDESDELIF